MAQAQALSSAAAAVEEGRFDPESIAAVASRQDALGQLARVFQRMAREVQAREARLARRIEELRIEVDDARKTEQVAEITGSDYFLAARARRPTCAPRSQRPRRLSASQAFPYPHFGLGVGEAGQPGGNSPRSRRSQRWSIRATPRTATGGRKRSRSAARSTAD